jgi:hypothetical protein
MTPLMNLSRILVLPAILSALFLTERVYAAEPINPPKTGAGAAAPSGPTLSPPKTGAGPTVPPAGVLNSPTTGPGPAAGGVLHVNGPIEVPPINPTGPGSGIICCAVTSFPIFPNLLGQPDSVTSPYALQIMTGPTIVNSALLINNAASTANNLVFVHNPAVWFNFPVTPDAEALGTFDSNYKAIGFTGTVSIEACLSGDEAKNWPSLTPEPADPTTCPTVLDPVNDAKLDADGNVVKDANGNPVPGQNFIFRTWYQVGFPANADLYVTQNGSTVSNAGIVAAPVQLAVTLQQVLTPMRFHVTNGAEYLYVNNHTGPNDATAACAGVTTAVCLRFLSGLNFGGGDFYTPPINVVTLPMAMIQLKVVPQTIIYMPPGNNSTSCIKRTQTFSTTVTAGATTEVDNSNSQDDWMETAVQGDVTATIAKVFSLGFSEAQDDRWDTKTTLKTGQASEHDVMQLNQSVIWSALGSNSSKSAVPGAAGAFEDEPFWGDEVRVLVHPQLAVWSFSGRPPSVQLVAASAAGGAPDEIGIEINQLDSCARGVAPNASGYSFPTATGQTETLSAAECKTLAGLDPFYGNGQSATLTSRGQLVYGPDEYGTPPGGEGDHYISVGDTESTADTQTDTDTTTYASTVEDIVATKWSAGITFSATSNSAPSLLGLGLKNKVTLQQGSTIDTSQTMALTYKDSTAQTYRIDNTVAGTIDDTTARAQSPYVEIYRDSLFGSFMFRDPYAACSPMPACQATAAPAGPIIAKPVLPVAAVGQPTTPGGSIVAKPIQPVAVGQPGAPKPPVGVIRSIQGCSSSG